MLTMFEITLGNWPPACRVVTENVTEWFMLFALFHKLTVGFAVVGVINGVFMQETFRAAATNDRIMIMQKTRAATAHCNKMRKLFQQADTSGDGYLNLEEFKKVLQDASVRVWLASM